MKEECHTTNNNKLVVFQEKRSKLIIENRKQIQATRVEVDGCELTKGLRCDFLYLINDTEIFIELKGQDLRHALEQLEATINKLSTNPKKLKKKSIIICTRSPMSSATIQNYSVKFKKRFNADFIVKSTPYTLIE